MVGSLNPCCGGISFYFGLCRVWLCYTVLILVVVVFLFTCKLGRIHTEFRLNPCCGGISFYSNRPLQRGKPAGLNPCCGGISFYDLFGHHGGSCNGLNPCCGGISFYDNGQMLFRLGPVLILVVVVFLFTL